MEDQIQYAGQILGVTLFVVGLVVSWVVWRRRGAAYGLRGVAWSSLILAAGLTGLIDALWVFGAQLVGNVLNPVLWAGLGTGGFAVLLYVISGVMKARGVGTKGRGGKAGTANGGTDAAPPKAAPSGKGAAGQVGSGSGSGAGAGADADDFGDIEAILRERGIS
ncbi:cellulose synthase [Spiractinospora alimapuensis]|uniref:cellulose synthase n=1 Tax=Spiractinospora alimapuensis TaxID=2820884 RepID=UPI001F402A10|nr:cellulose synthase [Spiractinospora alimapuensis]QVQ52508.1 cellulose synthase [Spiractinospora alimapuensis]